jgi:hypothetical protein
MIRKYALVFCVLSVFLYGNRANALTLLETEDYYFRVLNALQSQLFYSSAEKMGTHEIATPVTFNIKRARMIFIGGHKPSGLEFITQLELVSSNTWSQLPLLDLRLNYNPHKMLTITVGRFLPNFTFYMPTLVTRLDMIEYPLMAELYPWRQVGLNIQIRPIKMLDIDVGIFNGFTQANNVLAGNGWNDDNMGKDFMLTLTLKPIDGLQVKGSFWFGMPKAADADPSKSEKADLSGTHIMFGGGVKYENHGILAAGEFYARMHNPFSGDFADRANFDLMRMGFHVTAGYRFLKNFQVLARMDMMMGGAKYKDANDNYVASQSQHIRVTLGFNWFLHEWIYFQLNYHLDTRTLPDGSTPKYSVDPNAGQYMAMPHTVILQANFTL